MPPDKVHPTSIRLSRSLQQRLAKAATQQHRPLAAQIVYILTQWVEWWEKQKK